MIRSFSKSASLRCCSVVEVKSKFGAEFRRFSLDRNEPGLFKGFHQLVLFLHHLLHKEIFISYADVHGDLLPINNDENFLRAVSSAQTVLRIFIQRQEDIDVGSISVDGVTRRKKSNVTARGDASRRRPHIQIGTPKNFRPVSSIIDVDILPECHRRVRLYCRGSDRPLGFYIRDSPTVRVTPHGLKKVLGIFISRLVPGGLAESTGLLAINDQVLEVNGIDVMGKTLDQVTDMMIANSHNLIITVKPSNQHNNIRSPNCFTPSPVRLQEAKGSISYPGLPMILASYGWTRNGYESDEDSDVVVVVDRMVKPSSQRSSAVPRSPRPVAKHRYRQRNTALTSYRSQPCLTDVDDRLGSGVALRKATSSQQHHRSNPAFRHSAASAHNLLLPLAPDVRKRLMLPQAAMEEDGIVITL